MGRYFKIADEFYKIYVPYFEQLLDDSKVGDKIKKLDLKLQFYVTDLKAQMLLDYDNTDEKIICGQTDHEGDIKIWLKSDAAHRLWAGKLALMPAIMSREIKALGPVDKLKELAHILTPANEIYKKHLTNMGYQDFLH